MINFTGAVPAPSKLDMSSDSKCVGENFLDDVVVKDGKLQNVFVFVKSGLPQAAFETPPTRSRSTRKAANTPRAFWAFKQDSR